MGEVSFVPSDQFIRDVRKVSADALWITLGMMRQDEAEAAALEFSPGVRDAVQAYYAARQQYQSAVRSAIAAKTDAK